MFTKSPGKMIFCFFLCSLLINVSMATDIRKTPCGQRHCTDAEKDFLTLLGLPEDTNDTEIIQLLDIPEKQIFAAGVIIYRKIYSATPKLLQIVNDANAFIPAKLVSARTLCSLGNKEWMPTIKALLLDPNSIVARSTLKIKAAGLLARAGDYSQFEIVATAISDNRRYVRFSGICELRNFGHKTDPVTDLAAELLTFAATSDPVPSLRKMAIYSLEKIAKIKTEITSKVIDALEANIHSPDKNLRIVCRVKLKSYGRELKKD